MNEISETNTFEFSAIRTQCKLLNYNIKESHMSKKTRILVSKLPAEKDISCLEKAVV